MRKILASLSFFACVVSISLAAREVRAASAGEAPGADTTIISEIVVTATKRSENIQSVPIAISVIGGDDIARQHLLDATDLARQTPNLFADRANAMPRFRLRGIGSNDFSSTATSAVGVYEDEVYLSAVSGHMRPLYDLDRAEVLRGPQGSLWGKNTTAGAINFITAKPSDTLNGQARVAYGSDDTREVEFGVGGPLSDKTSFRLAGIYKHRDGQLFNEFTGRNATGNDVWDIRGQFKWNISPDTTLLMKTHAGRAEVYQPWLQIGLLTGGADRDGYIAPADPNRYSSNIPEDTHVKSGGFDANLQMKIGSVTLTDIASFENVKSLVSEDDDGGPIASFHERYGGKANTFTNELRFASADDQRLGWIAGLYYLHESNTAFGNLGHEGDFCFPDCGFYFDSKIKTDNIAGFGSLNYKINPKLNLRAGIRYTWERKEVSSYAYDYVTNPSDVFDARQLEFLYIDTAQNRYIGSDRITSIPTTPPRSTWKKPTWDVALDYKATDDVMIFGRIARGFRSGNYNVFLGTPEDLTVYNPETLMAYEAGIKSTLLDRRLVLNLTAFHYDIKDMQVTVFQNLGSQTRNAAKAKVNGFEIDLTARPTESLLLNASYGFQDGKYKEFTNAAVPFGINQGAPLDLSGLPLERAPRHTVNFSGNYELKLGAGKLMFNTDWHYMSEVKFMLWADAPNLNTVAYLTAPGALGLLRKSVSQDAYWLGNATIGYHFDSTGLEVSAWVKNLTNKIYNVNGYLFSFQRTVLAAPGERRTEGVSVNYKF